MAIPKKLNEEQRKNYKRFFGGGADRWGVRGSFQLHLMKCMGLEPRHRLLDIGCGALKGGVHLISYLDPGNYCGTDRHRDLIEIGHEEIKRKKLEAKAPVLRCTECCNFSDLGEFDYALCFAIPLQPFLEQCLNSLAKVTSTNAKFYITHGKWFDAGAALPGWKSAVYTSPSDVEVRLDMRTWGWPDNQIFPIVELTRGGM